MARYSNETKAAVIEALRDGEKLNEVAARFGITRPTVKRWWERQAEYELSERHRAFVNAYFRLNMNGTRAYMEVYGVDPNVAAANASRLLRNAKVAQIVSDRIAQKAMDVDEVLSRLGDIARLDISPYVRQSEDGKRVWLDIDAMKADGLGHFIRGAYMGRSGPRVDIADPDRALRAMLDHHNRAASGREDDPIHVAVQPAVEKALERAYGDDGDDDGAN